MKTYPLAAALCIATACLFPAPDSTHLYVCAGNGDCPNGDYCDGGNCQGSAPASDAGACAAASCTAAGAVSLCDGGTLACPSGQTCDLGECFPTCSGGCATGAICDQAAGACVPNAACTASSCGSQDICASGVCTATPAGATVDAGCQPPSTPADAGAMLSGAITVFPDDGADTTLLDGGTVTFFFGGGSSTVSIQLILNQAPGYQISTVPPGPASALVTGNGFVPTYFPNLVVSAGTSVLTLGAVVSVSYLDGLAAATGHRVLADQLLWVGQASGCNNGPYIAGYTAGLSPAPAFVGYYDTGPQGPVLSPNPYSSTYGEFVAYGAPYATTRYVVTTSPSASLLQGTFTPPGFDGGSVAVALIYPNFSQ